MADQWYLEDAGMMLDIDNGSLSNHSNVTPTIMPDISGIIGRLHIGVIAGVTALVALIFIAVYIQLVLVLCYGYKLFSYQTVFLFNILFWASLRLTLYSFYYYQCCELVNNLSVAVEWFLVSAPEILLYLSLALLVHYFMEHLIKVLERRQEVSYLNPSYRRVYFYRLLGTILWVSSVVVFVSVNVIFSVLISLNYIGQPWRISRIVILEGLILLMGVVLGVCILVIYTTRAGKDIMEAKQVSKWQAIIISSLLILLFSSRAIYNIVVVCFKRFHTFNYAHKFATDLADFEPTKEGDIGYFCVLLLWEVVPICLIVLFFRIRSPHTIRLIRTQGSRHSLSSEHSRHFFDTPSSGTEISSHESGALLHRSSHVSIPSLPGQMSNPLFHTRAGYGSVNKTYHSVPNKYSINGGGHTSQSFMPGTTPPQLFTGSPSVFSDTPTVIK